MRIIKDGSVFRIELDSSVSEFETRISFAVDSHQGIKRPRLEISANGLKQLFMRMVPYISGEALVNSDYDIHYRLEVVTGIIAILDGIANESNFMRVVDPETQSRIMPFTRCPGCKIRNPDVEWKIFGDSPETCIADHKVPRWSLYTKCCNVRIGEVHDGYQPPYGNKKVWPRLGVG